MLCTFSHIHTHHTHILLHSYSYTHIVIQFILTFNVLSCHLGQPGPTYYLLQPIKIKKLTCVLQCVTVCSVTVYVDNVNLTSNFVALIFSAFAAQHWTHDYFSKADTFYTYFTICWTITANTTFAHQPYYIPCLEKAEGHISRFGDSKQFLGGHRALRSVQNWAEPPRLRCGQCHL